MSLVEQAMESKTPHKSVWLVSLFESDCPSPPAAPQEVHGCNFQFLNCFIFLSVSQCACMLVHESCYYTWSVPIT